VSRCQALFYLPPGTEKPNTFPWVFFNLPEEFGNSFFRRAPQDDFVPSHSESRVPDNVHLSRLPIAPIGGAGLRVYMRDYPV